MRYTLKAINRCPICDHEQRIDHDGMSVRKSTGYNYLKPAADLLNRTVEDLLEEIKVYQCANCQNFYCDPWFNSEVSSHIFCVGSPDHIAGWGNLEQWISSAHPNAVEKRNISLFYLVRDLIGPINSYAEFGCPFQGFLLSMKSSEEITSLERIKKFSQALQRQKDPRWSIYTKFYHLFESVAKNIIVWGFRLRSIKEERPYKKRNILNQQIPLNRKFLTEDTNIGWGVNCVRYGVNCRYFANRLLNADILPLTEFEKNVSNRFDLIGIFNFLDHSPDPLELIRRCLNISSSLLIVTHRASYAGRQHLFALNDSFSEWLKDNLLSTEVIDLSIGYSLPEDHLYILLTQKKPMEISA